MSWAYGERNGREVGYSVEAQCDEEGCSIVIDRGLAYRCGAHHLDDVETCEKFYCHVHLVEAVVVATSGKKVRTQVCVRCAEALRPEEDDGKAENGDDGD